MENCYCKECPNELPGKQEDKDPAEDLDEDGVPKPYRPAPEAKVKGEFNVLERAFVPQPGKDAYDLHCHAAGIPSIITRKPINGRNKYYYQLHKMWRIDKSLDHFYLTPEQERLIVKMRFGNRKDALHRHLHTTEEICEALGLAYQKVKCFLYAWVQSYRGQKVVQFLTLEEQKQEERDKWNDRYENGVYAYRKERAREATKVDPRTTHTPRRIESYTKILCDVLDRHVDLL